MSDDDSSYSDDAFYAWMEAMHRLTSEQATARSWRRGRYSFAHRLGEALVGSTDDQPALVGPVVYGVWLRWGLLYIGQTTKAEPRLRDLAVGESHHLPNTFPPEIWHKVLVVAWPELPQARPLAENLGPDVVGLALEHALQERLCPLVNSERRTPEGGWREVAWGGSRSRGARAVPDVVDLVRAVGEVWDAASAQPSERSELPPSCRLVFPGQLLSQKHSSTL
ncbi:hypothetical protein [Micromonospora sp. NPDC049662]|uniref:hypothetical protein n=1 Tax=unclassified Micromonospora TaxID=2617518 RepID=UPI00341B061B